MNILLAVFLFSVLLLALDLWTAPKPAQSPRPNLKDHGRIA
jgi:hypothetical protein